MAGREVPPRANRVPTTAQSELLPGIQVGVWAVTAACTFDTLVLELESNTPHLLLVTLAPVDQRIRAGLRETFRFAAAAADRKCEFAGVGGAEGFAVAVVWKNTNSCKPDVEQLGCICDTPNDICDTPIGIPAEAAAFKVTMGEEAHIVAAVSQARDVDVGWTEEFSKNLRNLMLEKQVRCLGVHSSGPDELADAATAVFANVVSVQVESQPWAQRTDYDATRAAEAGAFFGINEIELPRLIHAPVYLMAFGGAFNDDANYKIPGTNLATLTDSYKLWYGIVSGDSVRGLDKIPLAKNSWLDKIGPRYYNFKQIRAPLIDGVCAVHARAQDPPAELGTLARVKRRDAGSTD